ncbi:hypothetical protein QZH41_013566, partial [Actinostola sp. cb2023]
YFNDANRRAQLFIGGMFPLSRNSAGLNGSELLSTCELAVEMVNNRSDVLPNYELNLFYNDTKCNEGSGTRILMEYLLKRPPVIMLLGAGCSSVSRTVSQSAWQWNLVQVSYASTASELSDKNRYPLFYRVLPPDSTRIAALLSFLKFYMWNRIAILGQNDKHEVMSELNKEMLAQNFTIITSERFATNPARHIQNLKEKDARIIVAVLNQDMTRQVFCQAYKVGMYGSKYAWLLLDWFGGHWWLHDDTHVDCTKEQLSLAARGNFFIESMGLLTDGDNGVSGMTSKHLRNVLRKDRVRTNNFAFFAFDAVWVVALTLHKAAQQLVKHNKTLDMFDYKDREIAAIVRTSLQGLSFQGITVRFGRMGRIEFNKHGDRIGPIRIRQLQSKQYSNSPLHSSLRHLESYIKLSSANINNVIIVGAIFIYTSVLLIVFDSRVVQPATLPFLCSVFKDSELIGLVAVFVVMDVFIFTLWTALDPFVLSLKTVRQSRQSAITIIYQSEYCNAKHVTTWLYVALGYKALILLVGCFIAMATRKVKARALNDSQFIGASIFVIMIAAFIGIPLTFVIVDKNVVVSCFGLIIPTTISLCLIFVPKISKIRRNPEELLQLKSLSAMRNDNDYSNQSHDVYNSDVNTTIIRLQIDLARVRKELREQKALNGSVVQPDELNGYDDTVDSSPPKCWRKPFTTRSNTCRGQNVTDSPTSQPASQHRRYNTISTPSVLGVCEPQVGAISGHQRDLKVENASLRRKLRQTKINEAGKMCKVLYENAELNRKIVELSMSQFPGNDSDTVSRLMKENNELKKQLGEVSILNSVVFDTATPRMKRKATENNNNNNNNSSNKRDLRELQHLLTVDLGGGRASSFGPSRSKRPPTIGLSQSSLNLFDPKENRQEIAGESQDNEHKDESSCSNNRQEEEDRFQGNSEEKGSAADSLRKTTEVEGVMLQLNTVSQRESRDKAVDIPEPGSSSQELIGQRDNQGFLDDQESAQNTETADLAIKISDTSHDQIIDNKSEPPTRDKRSSEYDKSKTKELLEKGTVHMAPRFNYPTIEKENSDINKITNEADHRPNVSSEQTTNPSSSQIRTVIGSDNSESSDVSSQYCRIEEGTGSQCLITRKQRKSKRDRKTKIEKVEKTFFV